MVSITTTTSIFFDQFAASAGARRNSSSLFFAVLHRLILKASVTRAANGKSEELSTPSPRAKTLGRRSEKERRAARNVNDGNFGARSSTPSWHSVTTAEAAALCALVKNATQTGQRGGLRPKKTRRETFHVRADNGSPCRDMHHHTSKSAHTSTGAVPSSFELSTSFHEGHEEVCMAF